MTTPQPTTSHILSQVNEQQRQAVAHTDGPLLIIAGAGSGKTRVLTYRIANLLALEKAKPWEILSLTFTNKSAREMKSRIENLVGPEARQLWMGTFHSVFSRILRYECEHIGYNQNFSIYDSADSDRAIKGILQEMNVDIKEIKPRAVRFIISGAKNQLISPEEFQNKFVQSTLDDIAARVYTIYLNRLKQHNAMDFDDLLIKPIELFEKHPEILEKYQDRFKYILIDEYQDTNHAQYKVTQMLAHKHKNICVVGDDAQSIYSFRGADISNILNFKQDYPEAVEVPLEQNYRSTKHILKCADSIIRQNKNRLEKTLWTENLEGNTITLLDNYNERDEANRIASYIGDLKLKQGYSLTDFAILYRTNYQSRVFEDSLRRKGLSYQLVGGISFYQRKEIKDVVAYLKLLVNPQDEESLLRVINEPARGIGEKSLKQVTQEARTQDVPIWNILGEIQNTSIYKPAKKRIEEFVKTIWKARKKVDKKSLVDVTKDLLEETGYVKQFVEENSHESLQRRENVMELLNAISYFEKSTENPSLSTFLQDISLVTDLDAHDQNTPSVTLMTIHASKGLEFPVVFVVGLEEELFPIGGRNGDDVDMEEERRLFYVAITRAERELFFSFARNRYKFGEEKQNPRSRFLDEVDPSVVRNEIGATIKQRDSFNLNKKHSGAYQDYDWKTPVTGVKKKSGAASTSVHYDTADVSQLQVGARVTHQKFGAGKIISSEGQGDKTKVVVFFQKHGQKKLMLKFAKLQVL
ncbi:MAG: UvrD-helicase domain-containing protein [Balneolales bacterium]